MKRGITFSAWDLLHVGHSTFLEECKRRCNYLIVGLQTDPTVDRPNKNKPIQTLFERYVQLKSNKYVDEIIPYTYEIEIPQILEIYLPSVRFLGSDYIGRDFTAKKYGSELGIKVEFIPRHHRFSSSELRTRIHDVESRLAKMGDKL